ncbi:hypothetical protein [Cerasicoccus arenae]|uniref:Uncharacterized protein n=1 Tax=Cerasicoccus arenae TaxID=424488 RepID=A0A8J3GEU3_9BACT|nr:hypothetical protein [Cerasicoccus arenae]MBK1858576.1 hypothetical protein [Cerasicoccus arenae]GHC06400.1 hypothetical protein GCM10007047_24420 [Cerasicoccus arenae]
MKYTRILPLLFVSLFFGLSLRAEWSLYDGFDYNTKLLDGADGGVGSWTSYWRRSGAGGVELKSPTFTYKDRSGKSLNVLGEYTSVKGATTAGTYRDFEAIEAGNDEPLVMWVSFLASAEGGPFDASGDEVSLQLRSPENVDWVTFGVMGRLDAWRIRLSNGSQKKFTEGASGIYTNDVNFFVARIEVDTREGKSDSVFLWINPLLGRQPDDSAAALKVDGEDIWKPNAPVKFTRMRIGTINSEDPEDKALLFDEIRIGASFQEVAPEK